MKRHAFLHYLLLWTKVVVVPITAGIPQILSSSPRYYRGFYPHSRGNTAVIVLITAVVTAVTVVLPPSPSPSHSLTDLSLNSATAVTSLQSSERTGLLLVSK